MSFGTYQELVIPPLAVDRLDAVLRDGTQGLTADWDAGSHRIRAETFHADVATGTAPLVIDSTTVVPNLNADMVDGQHASDLAASSDAVLRDGSQGLTADWDAGSHQIRAETFHADVATGTAPLVVASTTKVTNLNADMVDGLHAADLLTDDTHRLKQPVRAASVGDNLTLSGTQTVDGVSLQAGDRILVKDQSTASENGVYVVAGGAWSRGADFQSGENVAGALMVVLEGDLNGDTIWLCTSDEGGDYVPTDSLAFRQAGGIGGIKADSDAATVTFDLAVSSKHELTLGGNRTLDVANPRIGQVFLVRLTQDGSGSRTVTWWSGIDWPDAAEPALTTTGGKTDVFVFVVTGTDAYGTTYDGFTVGQNL